MSEATVRVDGRGPLDIRPLKVEMGYLEWAEGSALLEMGKTLVLVAASFEPKVPRFLQGSGSGWVSGTGAPQALTRVGSGLWTCAQDRTTEAKASLTSKRSRSPIFMPVRSRSRVVAWIGPSRWK